MLTPWTFARGKIANAAAAIPTSARLALHLTP